VIVRSQNGIVLLKIVKEDIVLLLVVSVSAYEPVISPNNRAVAVAFALSLLIGFLALSRNARHLVSGVTTVVGVNANRVVSPVLKNYATDLENSCLEIPLFAAVPRRLSTSLAHWFHAPLIARSVHLPLVLVV
jgi:hypothetical protein